MEKGINSDELKKNFKVDFFCLGAPKCGSTWLATCLNEHPQITIAKGKEPNFFCKKIGAFGNRVNKNYMKDWTWYENCFSHAQKDTKLGDMSINLLHNISTAPFNIKKYFPNAKLIVILRDPVKRTYSHYWHEKLRDRIPETPNTFEEAFEDEVLLFQSNYYAQLKEWFKVFSKEQFLIILDIDLKKNVLEVWRSLCSLLEIDRNFTPPSLYKKVNEANKMSWHFYYSRKVAKYLKTIKLQILIRFFKKTGVAKWLENTAYIKYQYPPINKETERILRSYFLSDIEKLEKLIDRDLSEWKQTTP